MTTKSRPFVNAAPPARRRPWGLASALAAGLVYGGLVLSHPGTSGAQVLRGASEPVIGAIEKIGEIETAGAALRGSATWYGPGFQGLPTASGEIYDMEALTAAHPTLPLGSRARVTNLDNGRTVVVRINDRGPVTGKVIDLSRAAAREIHMLGPGSAQVEVAPLSN
jgi:rare lipoprotein A (peptidoglycan hydrolase)